MRRHRATIFARKYAFCSIFQSLPDYLAEFLQKNLAKFTTFATFAYVLLTFRENCSFFNCNANAKRIFAVQKYAELVDRVKSFLTIIYLQTSTSIQPRTSTRKFGLPAGGYWDTPPEKTALEN